MFKVGEQVRFCCTKIMSEISFGLAIYFGKIVDINNDIFKISVPQIGIIQVHKDAVDKLPEPGSYVHTQNGEAIVFGNNDEGCEVVFPGVGSSVIPYEQLSQQGKLGHRSVYKLNEQPHPIFPALPCWRDNKWKPLYYGRELMDWPVGFDPATLKPPKYNIGDTVKFKWGDGIREGVIQEIYLHGGAYNGYEKRSEAEIAVERYSQEPNYTIYWNAHGRYVYERNIIE